MRGNQYGSARALLAFRDGDKGSLGMAGAMLAAEGIAHLRYIADWLKAFSKSAGKKGPAPRGGLRRRGRRR